MKKKIIISAVVLTLILSVAALGESKQSGDCSYAVSDTPHESYPDTNNAELTDGTFGASWPLDDWVAWYNPGTLDITVTLDRDCTITTAKAHCQSRTDWGIYFPLSMQVYVQRDGSGYYQEYGASVSPPSDTSGYSVAWLSRSSSGVGKKVKFSFNGSSEHNFFDEVEVWGDVKYYDLGVGKFYTFSDAPNGNYPDEFPVSGYSDGSELTDEGFGVEWPMSHFVGWYHESSGSFSVDVDLGKSRTIDEINIHCASRTDWDIYFPTVVYVYTSSNGTNWSFQGYIGPPSDTSSFSTQWLKKTGLEDVTGRYVRYKVYYPADSYTMIDELEILGELTQTWKCVPSSGAYNGAYPTDNGYLTVETHQDSTEKTLAMVLWYHEMNPSVGGADDFSDDLSYLWSDTLLGAPRFDDSNYIGYRLLEIGWLPYDSTAEQIAQGNLYPVSGTKYDQHFKNWFEELLNDDRNGTDNNDPIFLRPMSEMNLLWHTPGQGDPNSNWGGDPTNYKRAWRRMFNIAEKVGADVNNVFVWAPNGDSDNNTPDPYYPGDQYVDWVGVSVYNFHCNWDDLPIDILDGTAGTNSYDFLTNYSYKPMMIAEGGIHILFTTVSHEDWINGWFALKNSAPPLKSYVWYNDGLVGSNYDFDDLSSAAKNEFRSEIQDSYWQTTH